MSFPSAGDLPVPGIEPSSPASSALAGRFFFFNHCASWEAPFFTWTGTNLPPMKLLLLFLGHKFFSWLKLWWKEWLCFSVQCWKGENLLEWRAQTNPCAHQDPRWRTSVLMRDWARLAYECLGVSSRGVGWQWPAVGSRVLTTTVLEQQHAGISAFEGNHH